MSALDDDAHDLATRALAFLEDHGEALEQRDEGWLAKTTVMVVGSASILLDRVSRGES